MNLFSEAIARDLATPASFQKGRDYHDSGRVTKLWQDEGVYQAKVRGTRSYIVSIKVEGGELLPDCSCPYDFGGICKHAVAAILAFSNKKEIEKIKIASNGRKKVNIQKLVGSASKEQLRAFVKQQLQKSPGLVRDLQIFLQGPKATPTTVKEYKAKIQHQLNLLDMNDLVQQWYADGDDYYDYHPKYAPDFGPSLAEAMKDLFDQANKYLESQNIAECYKIYQALFESLDEKRETLHGEERELEDWFEEEMGKALKGYGESMAAAKDRALKKAGIQHLCALFETLSDWQEQIVPLLKRGISSIEESAHALKLLSKSKVTKNLSFSESSLYAFLHWVHQNYDTFEKVCLNHLKDNPQLAVEVMRWYQDRGKRKKLIATANEALGHLVRQQKRDDLDFSFWARGGQQDIEKEIRLLLKETYNKERDYQAMIQNLEQLFLITGLMSDYKIIVQYYRSKEEKEAFIQRLKKKWGHEYELEKLFKVFDYEGRKEDILELIERFPTVECFPRMIASIQSKFPHECFEAYQKKIKALSLEAKTKLYPEVAYHLKQMQKIGLTADFSDFVFWIKQTYWRRRRLLEKLAKEKL